MLIGEEPQQSKRLSPRIEAVTTVLTTRCNLDCTYCFQTERNRALMPWPVLERAVDVVFEHGAPGATIGLTGGEPLLALGLVRTLIDHLHPRTSQGQRPPITITTNGLLLDDQTTRFLAASRITVRLSFDGLAQNLRAPGTFDRLDETVLRIRRTEPVLFHERLTVIFTLTAANLGQLADSFAYLLGLGLPSIEVFPISTHDRGWNEDATRELDRQWTRVVDLSAEHLRRTGAVPLKMLHDRPRPATSGAALCSAGRGSHLLVDVDGSVHGCTMLARSYQRLPTPWHDRLGATESPHIMDPDVLDRLAAAAECASRSGLFHLRATRHSALGRCADCAALETCMTCPVATVHIPGNTDPDRVPLNQCAFNRVVHAHRDRFPARSPAIDFLTGRAPLPTAMTDIVD